MSREIKVRVYDSITKELITLQEAEKRGVSVLALLEGKVFETTLFTGLHDKNKKEIYEGDVLYDDHHEEYGLVVFEEGGFRVNWETTTDDLFENCDVLEIAGNIYETLEVLEGADE